MDLNALVMTGIDVGHQFFSRAEMVVVGFHGHWLNGIDFIGSAARNSVILNSFIHYSQSMDASFIQYSQIMDALIPCVYIIPLVDKGLNILCGHWPCKKSDM